ncbi:hypothetical protein BJX64DRAFT_136213 [Aspergillus heterothallicus]
MKFTTFLSLLPIILLPVLANPDGPWIYHQMHHSADADDNNRIEGYNTTELEWDVEVHPETRKRIVARGTIEQVREEALKHNPDWDKHYFEPAEQKLKRALETGSFAEYEAEYGIKLGGGGVEFETESETESSSSSHLAKRKFSLAARDCGGRWKEVNWDTALRNANKLALVEGHPKQGPGPGNCGRVSCRESTAIWWCNDEPYDRMLLGFDRIVEGAYEVINPCGHTPFGDSKKTSGQAFATGGWNVIVRKDKC